MDHPTYGKVEDRVARGLATLTPEQIDRIDLYILDIADYRNCVMGQLFGTYMSYGAEDFLADIRYEASPAHYGFDCSDQADRQDLNDEWTRQISAHREHRKLVNA